MGRAFGELPPSYRDVEREQVSLAVDERHAAELGPLDLALSARRRLDSPPRTTARTRVARLEVPLDRARAARVVVLLNEPSMQSRETQRRVQSVDREPARDRPVELGRRATARALAGQGLEVYLRMTADQHASVVQSLGARDDTFLALECYDAAEAEETYELALAMARTAPLHPAPTRAKTLACGRSARGELAQDA